MSVIFFCTDFFTLFLLRNTMGAFINYVDVFLDLFVPLFPLYRIEVALINKIAHGALVGCELVTYKPQIMLSMSGNI